MLVVAAVAASPAAAQRYQVEGAHVVTRTSEGHFPTLNRPIDEVYVVIARAKNSEAPEQAVVFGRVGGGVPARAGDRAGPYAVWDGVLGANDQTIASITLVEDDAAGAGDRVALGAGQGLLAAVGAIAGTAIGGPVAGAGGTAAGTALGKSVGALRGDDDVLGHYVVVLVADAAGHVTGHLEPGHACRADPSDASQLVCTGDGGRYRPIVRVNGVTLGPTAQAIPPR